MSANPSQAYLPKLPDFLIVGAMKSATTTLWEVLRRHPLIFMPNLKEPHFFSSPEYLNLLSSIHREQQKIMIPGDLDSYQGLFRTAQHTQLCGEASASYFLLPHVSIPNILKHAGDIKIIISLRNPYERSWSEYQASYRYSAITDPEKTCLKEVRHALKSPEHELPQWIEQSLYFDRVVAFISNFSSVKVMLVDDLQKSPDTYFSALYNFLDIPPHSSAIESLHVNRGSGFLKIGPSVLSWLRRLQRGSLRHVLHSKRLVTARGIVHRAIRQRYPLPYSVKTELKPIIQPDIIKLEKLLQKDLSDWYLQSTEG